jgi:hypothetical protein
MHVELLEDVMNVVLDRRVFDAEAPGDLLVRQALVDEVDDLQLARGESADSHGRTSLEREGTDPPEEAACDARGRHRTPPRATPCNTLTRSSAEALLGR